MIVRLRQIADGLRNGLSFVPLLFGIGAIGLALLMLQLDARWGTSYWPANLQTTGSNAQAILGTVAGGLISAVTLLLSLALVAVQLGSSQFSPRTISNWLGDRVLQVAIGVVVGTILFCLTILQASDAVDGSSFGVPHRSVFVAVILTVISLLGVVRSVDHLAKSLRIGDVSQTILAETLGLIERLDGTDPESLAVPLGPAVTLSDDGEVVAAPRAGWIQQVDIEALLNVCPAAGTIEVVKPVGTFVLNGAPLARIHAETADESLGEAVEAAFALGTSRTAQQDIPFGLVRLSDIGMRALSPGINDPNTAIDVLNYIATIVLALLSRPEDKTQVERDGRRVVLPSHTHAEYVDMAVSPIRRAAAGQPLVLVSIARLCEQIGSEIRRRDLPAAPSVFDSTLDALQEQTETDQMIAADRNLVEQAIADARRFDS